MKCQYCGDEITFLDWILGRCCYPCIEAREQVENKDAKEDYKKEMD